MFHSNLSLLEGNGGIYTGWWFQTCFIFQFIYGIILSIDELIFLRGVETTNQINHVDKHVLAVDFAAQHGWP